MKLGSDDNIWRSTTDLSGRDKGKIYAQRANYIVGRALSDGAAYDRLFAGGRIRRKDFARDIGCDRSTLYANPEIKALIEQVEGRTRKSVSETGLTSVSDRNEVLRQPASVEIILDKLSQGHEAAGGQFSDRIITTNRSCRIDGQSYVLPTIILRGIIQAEASDYLRYIIKTEAVELSSALQYAKVLRAFLRYCRQKHRDWTAVDDRFLTEWRDFKRTRVDDTQVISDLSTVFNFYVWAEEHNYLSYHVGVYEKGDLPKGFTMRDFPITARRKKGRQTNSSSGWASTLTFRVSKAIEGRRNTPNDDQVSKVHEELLKTRYGERDCLIAAWAEEAGPRRAEILQIRRSQLPTREELAELFANETNLEIKIPHRKRRSKASLSANPWLLSLTLDWIEGGRRKLVEECRRKLKSYRDPDQIFISSKTGQVLKPDSVTKLMGTAFRAAGVTKASLHRLRAKAIVEELEKHVDAYWETGISVEPNTQWAETILTRVAQMAGHASPMSLRSYLNFVLARRVSLSHSARRERVAEENRHLDRQILKRKAELNEIKDSTT